MASEVKMLEKSSELLRVGIIDVSELIRSTCRSDVEGFDNLADATMNKKLLQKLLRSSKPVSRSGDGTIWRQEAANTGVFYFVSHKAPDAICLFMPHREIALAPELSALEVCSWQSTILGGYGQGWRAARDRVFELLLRRAPLIVSSDRLNVQSGGRFWEDRVGQHILAGGRGGSVLDDALVYQDDYTWVAPDHLGRDGRSRFFIQLAGDGLRRSHEP